MCDSRGMFICQGLYDESKCEFNHCINPYESRESRKDFESWHLDHTLSHSELKKTQYRNTQIK